MTIEHVFRALTREDLLYDDGLWVVDSTPVECGTTHIGQNGRENSVLTVPQLSVAQRFASAAVVIVVSVVAVIVVSVMVVASGCGTGGRIAQTAQPQPEMSEVEAISVGAAQSCALIDEGSVVCWGEIIGRVDTPAGE